ncbi:MAG: hypothetical protein ACOC4B_00845 [Bacteroidota bacterium]
MCKIFFWLFLLIPFLKVYSQEEGKVVVHDAFDSEEINKETHHGPINHNVKWNISLLGRGAFNLAYEYRVSDYIAPEVGLGVVYKDLLLEVFNEDLLKETSNVNLGFMMSAFVKIYFNEMDDFEGTYVGPLVRYRDYNIKTDDFTDYSDEVYDESTDDYVKTNINTFTEVDISYSVMEYGFVLGYQEDATMDLMCDYYIGVGFRNVKYKDLILNESTAKYSLEEKSFQNPFLLLGMSFGFAF